MRGFMTTVAKNEKGLASIETIALLVVFAVLIGYGLGYFGSVHTAIMNSMAARTYAFETFDNRVDLTYFRSNRGTQNEQMDHYANYGFRAHGIASEYSDNAQNNAYWTVTERSISIARPAADRLDDRSDDDNKITGAERGQGVNPVWIKVIYGICINHECGGAGS